MPNHIRFGVFLPSFIWEDDGPERVEGLIRFAKRVEELGFDSAFVTDHVITARHFYSASFLEPLLTLSFVASVTSRLRLGVSVLILPIRHPVMLAKQVLTLDFLASGRLILGAGIGWYEPEFEALGVKKRERGKRSDETLAILNQLLAGREANYSGEFYQTQGVTIEPRLQRRPEVWIGGGRQIGDPRSPEKPHFAEAVKARVAMADGWISRATCTPDDIAVDWRELQDYLVARGKDPSSIVVAHENFMHVVMNANSAEAKRQQHLAFSRVMSDRRGPDYLESVYLFGTPDEMIAQLQARADAGVRYFLLHTLTPDPRQLELWTTEILPHIRVP